MAQAAGDARAADAPAAWTQSVVPVRRIHVVGSSDTVVWAIVKMVTTLQTIQRARAKKSCAKNASLGIGERMSGATVARRLYRHGRGESTRLTAGLPQHPRGSAAAALW
jgi:hypothetical protein